jgi:hypothetical protein
MGRTKRLLCAVAVGATAVFGVGTSAAFAGEVTGNEKPTPIADPENGGRFQAGSICAFSGQNDDPSGGGDPLQAGQTQNWGHTLDAAKTVFGDGDNGANELASMINAAGPGTNCRGFASGG